MQKNEFKILLMLLMKKKEKSTKYRLNVSAFIGVCDDNIL